MGEKTATPGRFTIPTMPAAGTGVTGGAANTYTTNAVQMTASTSAAIFITGVTVQLSSTSKPTYCAVRLSTGAADGTIVDEEVIAIASTAGATGTQLMGYVPLIPPVPVANATRIGCKTADSVGSLAWLVTLTCINQSNVVDDGVAVATVTSVTNVVTANVTQIDGQATNGNNATLNLLKLNIVNSAGDAIVASSTGSNGHGINASGNGSGHGTLFAGGATGHGIRSNGGATSGNGISANASTGDGMSAAGGNGGNGLTTTGNSAGHGFSSSGGGTGHGAIFNGGATSGDGIKAQALVSGIGIEAIGVGTTKAGISATGGSTSSAGINAAGGGTGAGFLSTGGGTGNGATFVGGATSGHGLGVTTTSGNGLNISPTAGHGILLQANGTSKHGLISTGGTAGTSDGINAAAGTGGVDIRGNITGNLVGTVSTLTTYTGNTVQTGDAYARIGAAGVGLTNLGDTRIANLDATVSSRMATYTQPTGFLAATFPATVASTTNITAGTITTVSGNVNGNVTGSVGSVVAAVTLSAGDSPVVQSGTATAGGATTITIQTALGADNLALGCIIKITSGTGSKQARVITGYVDATKVATVDRAWTTNPDNTSVYSILYFDVPKTNSSLEVVAASVTGNVGGNVTGSVGSVVGAVGSVTGAVGSVTGNVGGNVVGSVASVTARVTANTDQWAGGTIPAPNVTGVPLIDLKYTLGTISPAAAGSVRADSVTGAVGSVTGSVGSVVARVTANTDQLAGQTVTAAAGVTFPTSVASPTNITAATGIDITKILGTAISTPATAGILDVNVKNIDNDAASASGTVTFPNATLASTTNITAGTITTVTNLTNAATAGDFTATMKTSLNASTPASITGAVGSVTGNVGGNLVGNVNGNVVGTVASVVGNVGGNVTGSVGSVLGNVAGNVTGTIGGFTTAALIQFFTTNTTKVYADAVAGSIIKETATGSGAAAPSLSDFFTVNTGKVYADAVDGSVVKEIAENSGDDFGIVV